MTIHELVQTLDTFRDEYNTSKDPEIRKLCGFITNVIDRLNDFSKYFVWQKSRIQRSQEYYEEALVDLNNLIGDVNVEPLPVPGDGASTPTLEDTVGQDSGLSSDI